MKVLRLLLNTNCDSNCSYCCNKQYDLLALPQVELFSFYKMILLTGGEPMLKTDLVRKVIKEIREETKAPIILYTAKVDRLLEVASILSSIEGMTLTLHAQKDVFNFRLLNNFLKHTMKETKSLRLNVFRNIDLEGIDTSLWQVKTDIVPLAKCPVVKGEVFMRY